MQVVSGRLDNPKVHYEAVPRERLELELNCFVQWFNQTSSSLDGFTRRLGAFVVCQHPPF